MIDYLPLESLRGPGMHGDARRLSDCPIACPVCDSHKVRLTESVDGDGKGDSTAVVDFACDRGHKFRLEIGTDSGGVGGMWSVMVGGLSDRPDAPTLHELNMAEAVSQRLGMSNPWSDSRCLFPMENAADGIPLFQTCGVGKASARAWIDGHINSFHDVYERDKNPSIFAVWRLRNPDGSYTIGFSPLDGDIPEGAEFWSGCGVITATTEARMREREQVVRTWTIRDPLWFVARRNSGAEKKALVGSWKNRAAMSDGLYQYRKAQRTAQACALYELEQGHTLTNAVPNFEQGCDPFSIIMY